jgi:hypothetical protein
MTTRAFGDSAQTMNRMSGYARWRPRRAQTAVFETDCNCSVTTTRFSRDARRAQIVDLAKCIGRTLTDAAQIVGCQVPDSITPAPNVSPPVRAPKTNPNMAWSSFYGHRRGMPTARSISGENRA